MEDLISDLMMHLLLLSGAKKLLVRKNWFCAVACTMLIYVGGATWFGSPWVV